MDLINANVASVTMNQNNDLARVMFANGMDMFIPTSHPQYANVLAWEAHSPNNVIKLYQGPTLDEYKQNALFNMSNIVDQIGQTFTVAVPDNEKNSWSAKLVEAKMVLANTVVANSINTPLLHAETSITGETYQSLANIVVTSATVFSQAAGAMAGLRRVYTKNILAANTVLDVDALISNCQSTVANTIYNIQVSNQ